MTVRAAAVIVPAHNESETVEASLASVLSALAFLTVPGLVVMVDDGSRDKTGELADRVLADHAHITIRAKGGNVGRARHLGVMAAIQYFATVEPADIWIATTDADSWVPQDWLLRQVAHAAVGIDAVAGIIELSPCDQSLRHRFEEAYRGGIDGATHRHVHGANLGFRGSVYQAAGGFPPLACGEDNALWRRFRDGGFALESDTNLKVLTSSRTQSRAIGGVGTHLGELTRG